MSVLFFPVQLVLLIPLILFQSNLLVPVRFVKTKPLIVILVLEWSLQHLASFIRGLVFPFCSIYLNAPLVSQV
jgi:hypothetical protein